MQKVIFNKEALVIGENALRYLEHVNYKRAVIVTGGQSMIRTGVIDKIKQIMKKEEAEIFVYSGISKNPTTDQVYAGVDFLRTAKPDVILAVGGGSAIDAAKVMLLFYDHPELNFDNVFQTDLSELSMNTKLIAVPSTSGTASEVTQVSVITFEKEAFKFAVKTENIRPDIAILDAEIPLTLPFKIAAETGLDALTHALEAYINKNGNDFTDALAKEAIEGLVEWLPISCKKGSLQAREKVHNFQCMAGMAFSNSGLGMVHGVSHAFGGKYNLAHGLTNAVILPYSMYYNRKDPEVAKKYDRLSKIIGCDIIEKVKAIKKELEIPDSISLLGITQECFNRDFDLLVDHSMKGATVVNPVAVSREDMAEFIKCIYYGKEVDF